MIKYCPITIRIVSIITLAAFLPIAPSLAGPSHPRNLRQLTVEGSDTTAAIGAALGAPAGDAKAAYDKAVRIARKRYQAAISRGVEPVDAHAEYLKALHDAQAAYGKAKAGQQQAKSARAAGDAKANGDFKGNADKRGDPQIDAKLISAVQGALASIMEALQSSREELVELQRRNPHIRGVAFTEEFCRIVMPVYDICDEYLDRSGPVDDVVVGVLHYQVVVPLGKIRDKTEHAGIDVIIAEIDRFLRDVEGVDAAEAIAAARSSRAQSGELPPDIMEGLYGVLEDDFVDEDRPLDGAQVHNRIADALEELKAAIARAVEALAKLPADIKGQDLQQQFSDAMSEVDEMCEGFVGYHDESPESLIARGIVSIIQPAVIAPMEQIRSLIPVSDASVIKDRLSNILQTLERDIRAIRGIAQHLAEAEREPVSLTPEEQDLFERLMGRSGFGEPDDEAPASGARAAGDAKAAFERAKALAEQAGRPYPTILDVKAAISEFEGVALEDVFRHVTYQIVGGDYQWSVNAVLPPIAKRMVEIVNQIETFSEPVRSNILNRVSIASLAIFADRYNDVSLAVQNICTSAALSDLMYMEKGTDIPATIGQAQQITQLYGIDLKSIFALMSLVVEDDGTPRDISAKEAENMVGILHEAQEKKDEDLVDLINSCLSLRELFLLARKHGNDFSAVLDELKRDKDRIRRERMVLYACHELLAISGAQITIGGITVAQQPLTVEDVQTIAVKYQITAKEIFEGLYPGMSSSVATFMGDIIDLVPAGSRGFIPIDRLYFIATSETVSFNAETASNSLVAFAYLRSLAQDPQQPYQSITVSQVEGAEAKFRLEPGTIYMIAYGDNPVLIQYFGIADAVGPMLEICRELTEGEKQEVAMHDLLSRVVDSRSEADAEAAGSVGERAKAGFVSVLVITDSREAVGASITEAVTAGYGGGGAVKIDFLEVSAAGTGLSQIAEGASLAEQYDKVITCISNPDLRTSVITNCNAMGIATVDLDAKADRHIWEKVIGSSA